VLREALASKWPRAFSMFASWDDANTGYVSKPEFRKAVAMLGIVASRTDVEGIFDSFDPDRDGSIEYRQLGEELMNEDHAPPPAPPAALKAKAQLKDRMVQRLSTAADLFRQWDSDGNGLIDKAEFRKAVAALGIEASDEACDLAFDDYDHDGSGEMSYTEYVRYSLRDALKRSAARVMDCFASGTRIGRGASTATSLCARSDLCASRCRVRSWTCCLTRWMRTGRGRWISRRRTACCGRARRSVCRRSCAWGRRARSRWARATRTRYVAAVLPAWTVCRHLLAALPPQRRHTAI